MSERKVKMPQKVLLLWALLATTAVVIDGAADIAGPAPAPGGEGGEDSCDTIFKDGECNAGCICTALTTGFTGISPVYQSPMQIFTPGMMGGRADNNMIDAICLGLGNPGAAKDAFNEAMGAESGAEAGSESKGEGLLGEEQECLDLCLRLSSYIQEPVDGLHCTLFKKLPATVPTDPYGIPTMDFEKEADAGSESGEDEKKKKFRFKNRAGVFKHTTLRTGHGTKVPTEELPSLWQSMGLKRSDVPAMYKTAKYYRAPETRKLTKHVPEALVPDDVFEYVGSL